MTTSPLTLTQPQVAVPPSTIQSSKPVAKPAHAPSNKTTTDSSAGKTDSVQLSGIAQAAIAALKEAAETPAQTAREANTGDPQAKRLLAKESASRAAER